MGEFDGKVALVKGGGRGIGAAVCALLLERGARVVAFDLDPSGAPEGAVQVAGDATDSSSVADAIARVEREVGPLHAVVCCAGTAGDSLRTVDVSDEEWRRVFALNCDGVFYFNREAARVMVPRGSGRIVNVASIAGKEGNPNAAHYSASKAGLIALTKSLGKELAQHDILVNAVTPAAAKTAIFDQLTQQHIDFIAGKEGNPMAAAYSASKAAVIGMTKSFGKDLATTGVLVNAVAPAVIATPMLSQMSQEHIDYMVEKIPMGRLGQPEEVAELIAFLASERMTFSTGATFDISGGRATF
jgi:2-dehydro-3-deoxy-L-rhamnonate dehydrogenase (NAD+)